MDNSSCLPQEGQRHGSGWESGSSTSTSSHSTSSSSCHSSSSSTAVGGMTRGGMTYMLWVPKQFVELIFLLFFVIAENKHNKSECLIFAPAT